MRRDGLGRESLDVWIEMLAQAMWARLGESLATEVHLGDLKGI